MAPDSHPSADRLTRACIIASAMPTERRQRQIDLGVLVTGRTRFEGLALLGKLLGWLRHAPP